MSAQPSAAAAPAAPVADRSTKVVPAPSAAGARVLRPVVGGGRRVVAGRGRDRHDRHPGGARVTGQAAAPRVVDADDGLLAPLRDEQRGLGGVVVLEVGVEVEVVLAQVRETRDVVTDPVDPVQREGVARDLHRARVDLLLAHHGEQRLQVGRLRGGAHARHPPVGDPGLDRAHQPGGAAGRPQRRLEQVAGGGLPVRPGDAEHHQVVGGTAVDLGRHLAQHPARVGCDEQRHAGGPAEQVEAHRVGEDGHGALPHHLVDEPGAVHGRTRQRGVEVTGAHRPRVVGDPAQDGVGRRRSGRVRAHLATGGGRDRRQPHPRDGQRPRRTGRGGHRTRRDGVGRSGGHGVEATHSHVSGYGVARVPVGGMPRSCSANDMTSLNTGAATVPP